MELYYRSAVHSMVERICRLTGKRGLYRMRYVTSSSRIRRTARLPCAQVKRYSNAGWDKTTISLNSVISKDWNCCGRASLCRRYSACGVRESNLVTSKYTSRLFGDKTCTRRKLSCSVFRRSTGSPDAELPGYRNRRMNRGSSKRCQFSTQHSIQFNSPTESPLGC